MFTWYRETTGQVRRVFWTCAFGWGLDAVDGLVYQYLIPVLMSALGLTLVQAGAIASTNYFASAAGGLIGGWLCDRYGRARILQLTILWFSVFACLSGFAHDFNQLLILRTLQGLGFGAEWAVGAVLLGEMITPKYRGRALGAVQSAAAVGSGVAALLAGPVVAHLPAEWGWRAIFWMGALPAILIFFIRRSDDESQLYLAAKQRRAEGAIAAPRPNIFGPGLIWITLAAALLAVGAQGAGFVVSNYLTTFLRTERGLSGSLAGVYVLLNSAGGFVGFFINAWIGDRFGRRATFRLFAVGFVLAVAVYLCAPLPTWALPYAGFVYGGFQFGIYASFAPYFSELFPTEARGTGQAFSYNAGRAMSFIFIQGAAILAMHMRLSLGMALMGMAGVGVAFLATYLLPETVGRDLETVGAPAAGAAA